MRLMKTVYGLLCILFVTESAWAGPESHYFAAQAALESKNYPQYQTELAAMGDYFLKPLVEYQYLAARFKDLDDATIQDFISANSQAYVSNSLKGKWLRRLAKQGAWQLFDQHYSKAVQSTELECHYLNRQLRSKGLSEEQAKRIHELWLTSRGRPYSCRAVFKHWKRAGKLTDKLFWERMRLTVDKREKLSRSLAQQFLPAGERIWVDHLIAVHKKPEQELAAPVFSLDEKHSAAVVIHGLEQIARKDSVAAEKVWQKLSKQSEKLKQHAPEAYAIIGYRAAINHHGTAVNFFEKASFENARTREWAIRAAAWEGRWKKLLKFYDQLTDEEQANLDWRYWQARAFEETGKKKKAKDIYQKIAGEREFYSFLASDKLGKKYAMNDKPIKDSTKSLEKRPAFLMAKELLKIGEADKMRRQWEWAIHDLSPDEMKVAAKLAQKWELHDRAAFTVARAKHFDDLELRFPVLYKKTISKEAKANHLPISYVYGIIRQESVFMEKVRSPAGALGLMQIMPGTGRVLAKKQQRGKFRRDQLLDPKVNINMGTFFLGDLLGRFGGNYAMATAAYNAGPQRPPQWQGSRTLDADVWIENIPFNETRHYVKKVLFYKAIYDYRLKQKAHPLSSIMKPVPGR